ncbi:HAMP domain-containing histidine kinase [Puteibacter caeruleilacunae]|nr:HAMP domain-containing histidine kinase [Puteibacter caeruleilacunae]
MGRFAHRLVIILAIITISGIVAVQLFFLNHSLSLNEKKFHQTVSIALQHVVENLTSLNHSIYGESAEPVTGNIVQMLSNDYYVVNVNDIIDPEMLEHFLIKEFERMHINIDFEYAIYDCDSEKMVYGNYISADEGKLELDKDDEFPKYDQFTYYFGVYFPARTTYFNSELRSWYLFTGFILIVIIFFGYTLYIVFKQRRLTEVQKTFINNITHEFKTPLSSIAISSEVLQDQSIMIDQERHAQYVKIINKQTKKLQQQIERVLQLTTQENGNIKLKKESITLTEFVKHIVDEILIGNPSVKINIHTQGVELPILADPIHLNNIIVNLLDNAIKYCQQLPIIDIDIHFKQKHIQLCIKDNGIGIDTKHINKVFDKFYRVPTGDIHNVKGFGLGLEYVKRYIKLHGWKIRLKSELQKGSIFTIQIPS